MSPDGKNPNCSDPDVLVHVAWINMVKCLKVSFNPKSEKFDCNVIFSWDCEGTFLCGLQLLSIHFNAAKRLVATYHIV